MAFYRILTLRRQTITNINLLIRLNVSNIGQGAGGSAVGRSPTYTCGKSSIPGRYTRSASIPPHTILV